MHVVAAAASNCDELSIDSHPDLTILSDKLIDDDNTSLFVRSAAYRPLKSFLFVRDFTVVKRSTWSVSVVYQCEGEVNERRVLSFHESVKPIVRFIPIVKLPHLCYGDNNEMPRDVLLWSGPGCAHNCHHILHHIEIFYERNDVVVALYFGTIKVVDGRQITV